MQDLTTSLVTSCCPYSWGLWVIPVQIWGPGPGLPEKEQANQLRLRVESGTGCWSDLSKVTPSLCFSLICLLLWGDYGAELLDWVLTFPEFSWEVWVVTHQQPEVTKLAHGTSPQGSLLISPPVRVTSVFISQNILPCTQHLCWCLMVEKETRNCPSFWRECRIVGSWQVNVWKPDRF